MRVKQHREATLKRYLLGELDEEPRLEVEERLVMDPEFFELLGPSEDELTEEYLEGVLSPAERMAFERHFLINEDRRWQVGFVRLLKDRASAAGLPPTEMTAVTRTLPLRVERSSAQGADRTDAHAHLRGRNGRTWRPPFNSFAHTRCGQACSPHRWPFCSPAPAGSLFAAPASQVTWGASAPSTRPRNASSML